MPPSAAEVIDQLRGTGQLRILKGRLQTIDPDDAGHFNVGYTNFGIEHTVTADVIINCIGSESKFDQLDSPLVRNLLYGGIIRTDELRFGLDATPDGLLKNSDGFIEQSTRSEPL